MKGEVELELLSIDINWLVCYAHHKLRIFAQTLVLKSFVDTSALLRQPRFAAKRIRGLQLLKQEGGGRGLPMSTILRVFGWLESRFLSFLLLGGLAAME